MELPALGLFLVCAFADSYVQAVAGFAMGLLVIAIMGASGLVRLSEVAAAVSLVTLVNVVLSLRGRLKHLDKDLFRWLIFGQALAIGGGLWLLGILDQTAEQVLGLMLGSFITAGARPCCCGLDNDNLFPGHFRLSSQALLVVCWQGCLPPADRFLAGLSIVNRFRSMRRVQHCWPVSASRQACARYWWA